MKAPLLLLTVIALLSSCSFLHHRADTAASPYPMLDTIDAFDSAKVAQWHPTQAARDYAVELYHRGAELFAKGNQDSAAYSLLLQSLRTAPDPYVYLQMVPVAYGTGRIDIAFAATSMAARDRRTLGQAEMWEARLIYQINVEDLSLLERALQDYPFDLQAVERDSFFAFMKGQPSFTALLTKYRATSADRNRTLLKLFRTYTSTTALPYSIGVDSLNNLERNFIDPIYRDLIPGVADGRGEWSRGMNKEYDLVRELQVSPTFYTFVYKSNNIFTPLSPVQYFLATVDTAGHFIDGMPAGCFCSPLHVQTLQVDTGGFITLTKYDQQWEYAPEDSGYLNNRVTHRDSVGSEFFRIMYDGRIIATEAKPL